MKNNNKMWIGLLIIVVAVVVFGQGAKKTYSNYSTLSDAKAACTAGTNIYDCTSTAFPGQHFYCMDSPTGSCATYWNSHAGSCGSPYACPTCADSDGGDNINVYGTVTYNGQTYNDYCDGVYVQERFCYNNQPCVTPHVCASGYTCSGGKCVSGGCTDTAPSHYTCSGNILKNGCGDTVTDCSTQGTGWICGVAPGYSNKGCYLPASPTPTPIASPTPYNSPTGTCTDSDGGYNYIVKGTVVPAMGGSNCVDSCYDTLTLHECLCNPALPDIPAILELNCQTQYGVGMTCVDGACKFTSTDNITFTECGNGKCEYQEMQTGSCPADCGGQQTGCGNGICNIGETVTSCPTDCPSYNSASPTPTPSATPASDTAVAAKTAACALEDACKTKGLCTSNEAATTCVSDCAPFFQKWNKTSQQCDIDMLAIGLIIGALFALKMVTKQ